MSRFFRRRKFCRFTAEGVKEIDYKDLDTLEAVCFGDRQNSAEPHHRHQGQVSATAGDGGKRARYLALLPYTDAHN